MESSAKVVFEDIFEVTALNPDGYKFDRVNRIQGMYVCYILLAWKEENGSDCFE